MNPKPKKTASRSTQLIAAMHLAALTALTHAPQGQLKQSALMQAIEEAVELDDWARAVYGTTGNIRWRSIFAFASVSLVKAGYVTKGRGVWSITELGRAAIVKPPDRAQFLAEIKRRYQAWKDRQIVTRVRQDAQPAEEDAVVEAPDERMKRWRRS